MYFYSLYLKSIKRMMKTSSIYIFNPGHDLALANGSSSFVPPQAVQLMSNDLSLLPVWYADDNSIVLSPNAAADQFMDIMRKQLPILNKYSINVVNPVISSIPISSGTDLSICPWGWDKSVREYLKRCGIPMSSMPTDKLLDDIKWLSNRKRAVELLQRLKSNSNCIGESEYLTDLESCLEYVKQHKECVFKAPLSGSGKGLNWYRDGIFTSPFERWCHRQLSSQGGVIAEPVYSKIHDFAMEFYIDKRAKTSFAGYSFFDTSKTGVYLSNRLVSNNYDSNKEYMKFVTEQLKSQILSEVDQLFCNKYQGFLGIDMMLCEGNEDKSFLIHPCVEINSRMTMGIFSRIFYDRYVHEGREGVYHVDYFKKEGEAYQLHLEMQRKYPLHLFNDKIDSGYIPLIPINEQTHFSAWALFLPASFKKII